MRSRYRCSMCPAIHITSRSWLRSSSTHEPSDPPLRVMIDSSVTDMCVGVADHVKSTVVRDDEEKNRARGATGSLDTASSLNRRQTARTNRDIGGAAALSALSIRVSSRGIETTDDDVPDGNNGTGTPRDSSTE